MLTLEMLAEIIEEEGFVVSAIERFGGSTPWHMVAVNVDDDSGYAVEINKTAGIDVWFSDALTSGHIIATIPLDDPQCFHKMAIALRSK